jgi:triacylglycerol lipase
MTLELIEDAKGDPRNARTLAHASDLAYFGEAEGAGKYKDELELDARLISVGNTQVYIATNDDHIVAAFRGTESPTSIEGLKDWLLTDAVNLLIQPQGDLGTDFAAAGVGARWHQGFIRALGDVWDPFFEAITTERKKSDRPVWLTGHSLGGALALLAGWRLKRRFVPVHQIYTYGGPMVGDAVAIAAIDREFPDRIYRYVNSPDVVPHLPTVSLLANQYSHCKTENVLGEAGEAASGFLSQLGSKTTERGIQGAMFDEIWKGLQDRLAAHAMENYRSLVGKLIK